MLYAVDKQLVRMEVHANLVSGALPPCLTYHQCILSPSVHTQQLAAGCNLKVYGYLQ
jgi:hypothetical protein